MAVTDLRADAILLQDSLNAFSKTLSETRSAAAIQCAADDRRGSVCESQAAPADDVDVLGFVEHGWGKDEASKYASRVPVNSTCRYPQDSLS
jgi:hypothetical protein